MPPRRLRFSPRLSAWDAKPQWVRQKATATQKPAFSGRAKGMMQCGLQRIQIGNDVLEGQFLLLGFLRHAIDLLKGRNAANDLQHSIGVKC